MTAPTGDVAALRETAAQLRYRAGELSRVAGTVDARVASMGYTGPAAVRWRESMAAEGNRLRAMSARVDNAAELLVRKAALVEVELRLQALQRGL